MIRDDFRQRMAAFQVFPDRIAANEARFLAMRDDPGGPDRSGSFLSRRDAAAICTGLETFRPKRLTEVGSGNPTRFICRAIAGHGLDTQGTRIDPAPRIDIWALPVTVVPRVLSVADLDLVATLEAGDILFVDRRHILQQGLDVDILFNRAFPLLPAGVILHVQDIFPPHGYPAVRRGHPSTNGRRWSG